MNVADLKPKGEDASGLEIVCIYFRNPPEYAVYRTPQRVMVHYADKLEQSNEQRKALACLAPLRGEINGLVDGWRMARAAKRSQLNKLFNNVEKLRAKAERYDRRVADAVLVALEGDVPTATALMAAVKQDILDERIGWSRFEYLLTAFIAVLGVIALSEFAMVLREKWPCASTSSHFLCIEDAVQLWRGFAGGSVGAFFSIAVGIRGRTILPDLYRTANLMDAVLRVVVGAIGGVVLVSLVLAHFVEFHIGGSGGSTGQTALEIFIISFVAGFAERLVPDLLAKADTSAANPATAYRAPPLPPAGQARGSGAGASSTQQGAAGATASTVNQAPDDSDDDSSGADVMLSSDEITNDEDLPAASGGVASEPPAP